VRKPEAGGGCAHAERRQPQHDRRRERFGGEDGTTQAAFAVDTLYITVWAPLWKLENMPIPGLMWSQSKKSACN
jgi:hypothetical protein